MANSPFDFEVMCRTLADLLAQDGQAAEVAVLAYSSARAQQTGHDGWDGGVSLHTLTLFVPTHIFTQVVDRRADLEASILAKVKHLTRAMPRDDIESVVIAPLAMDGAPEEWRKKSKAWLSREGLTNQGRVRSDNVAPLTADGLLFRSQEEIHLYRALKGLGVAVAPLPVFVQGGAEYHRLEPEFVLVKDGIVMVVEVDGDTVHRETPAEAHARTSVLSHAGAYIERVPASRCRTPENARQCAEDLLEVMAQHKANR